MRAATPAGPPRYSAVLVPLDGSEIAASAIPVAAALAERFGAEVHTVTAADGDDPASVIARRADELGECLVCISTHGRGRVAGAVIGSVARSVLESRGEPIMAVGPAIDTAGSLAAHRIVACVDGGEASEAVIPVAAAWAATLEMPLSIVTVAEPSPPPLREDGRWHRHHGPEVDADAYVAELASVWGDTAPGVTGEVVYDPIGPGDGLSAHLAQSPAALVAVTTHARSGLERVVLGAGAASIVRASAAPVLVVPLAR